MPGKKNAIRYVEKVTELTTFRVEGRAVPWKAPTVIKTRRGKIRSFKDERLVRWQEDISDSARIAWNGREPYAGPVGICLWFYVHAPMDRRVRTADVTNLAKAAEDACKGIVIADDRQVFASHCERYFVDPEETQRTFVQFWAHPRGVIEPIDPGPFAFRPWDNWR